MYRSRLALLALVLVVASTVIIASCGAPRRLVSIQVLPDNVTFGGPNLVVNYKAIGSYENPVETRDITDSVLWESAAPQVISIDPATGIATSGLVCGQNITITASHFANQQAHTGAAIVGSVVASVTCP